MTKLPDDYQNFLSSLKPRHKDELADFPDKIYRLAAELKALKHCKMCGIQIVDASIFTENALEHYNHQTDDDNIESTIINSGVEISMEGFCPKCDKTKANA